MRLTHLRIRNFRSCRDVTLEIGEMHALVGANNAGKSSVLRALDFLFNPSTKSLNEESFWNKDTSLEIRVEAIFSDLTDKEKESLDAYLKADGTFHMARSARMGAKSDDSGSYSEQGEDKITIGQHYRKPMPEPEWLQESCINSNSIKEWWKNKDQLAAGGISFADFLGPIKSPTVGDWKEKAKEFVAAHADKIPMQEVWIDNPKGYANVLKGTLPFFVLVPAVRDVTDESKGTKNSPFGKLLFAILDTVTQEKRAKIEGILSEISKQMNRAGGIERVALIADTEKQLNALLNDFFAGCDLEIEFETPTLEVLLSTPRLYVDDGFRSAVENKGHGLQRAVIFTILRRYAEYMTSSADGKKRNLILAVEEPELYMHPQAQRTIRRVFRKIAEGGDQVLFSTHSSLLVDVAYFDEIIRMESRFEKDNGKRTTVSMAWQLPMSKMIEDLVNRFPNLKGKVTTESMRELYSHAYNPRRNEGFFASKVILVEGLTEEYSLPIYADALPNCAFDPQGISVIECGGKGAMDRLFRVFNELHIPCYILFDYDSSNTDKNIIAKSRELLALAGESQDAPQSLFVGDCIACFPNKWESDLRGEIPDADTLAGEAKKELGLSDDSGKPLIARYIARKLTERTPPQVPNSLKLIIEKAVAVKWSKSCLKVNANESVMDAKE
ncbi:ATP-dependent nuclease [Desulforudis sp. 1088]|uniref:ATP-dependent nuclease n=1 Tax=unclassified Candidatus Desulforudis TaxID=2635950 RepID=UPI003CE5AF5F